MVDPVSRKIFQYAASGIGLAAEVIHDRKQSKGKATERNESPPHKAEESDREVARIIQSSGNDEYTSSHMQQQAQEATWQLDQAQDQVTLRKMMKIHLHLTKKLRMRERFCS